MVKSYLKCENMDIKEQLGLLRKLFICRRDLIDPSGINMECTQLSASPPGEAIIHFFLGVGGKYVFGVSLRY